jgi:flagellar biogenesis protein FliO
LVLTLLQAASARGQQPGYLPPAVTVEARPLSGSLSQPAPQQLPFPFRQVGAEEPIGEAAVHAPIKLAPRNSAPSAQDKPAAASGGRAISSVVGSLAVVLGLFLVVVCVSRRFAPAGSALLPKEVIELLGRAPLAGRQSLQLVRVGNKLLLIALSPGGASTLTEVEDPLEVEHLTALCRRGRADSATASFAQVFGNLASEPAAAPVRSRSRGAT